MSRMLQANSFDNAGPKGDLLRRFVGVVQLTQKLRLVSINTLEKLTLIQNNSHSKYGETNASTQPSRDVSINLQP